MDSFSTAPFMTPYLLRCMFLVHFNACITPVEMFLCRQMKLTSVNASGLGKIVSVDWHVCACTQLSKCIHVILYHQVHVMHASV